MRLLLYSAMLLLQITFFLLPSAAQEIGDMEPLYIFTPGPAPGNCDQHKALLQTSFSEAIAMVTRGMNAIDSLGVPLSQIEDPGDRASWKTWAQLLKAIFNIYVDTKRGLNLDNPIVKFVKGQSLLNVGNNSYLLDLQVTSRQ